MGIIRTRIGRLEPGLREAMRAALADKAGFRSTEKDLVAWLILAFVAGAAGCGGAIANISGYGVATAMARWNGDLYNVALDNPEIPGAAAGAIVMLLSAGTFFLIHGRFGQAIFDGHVAKVRGSRLTMIRTADVAEASFSSFNYGSEQRGQRRGHKLTVKMKDGAVFKLVSDNRYWLEAVKDHIDKGA